MTAGPKRMRVLLATDNYPPYIGGAQIQSRLIARELKERGHEVVVVTVWQNDIPATEDDDGVLVHRLRQLRTLPLVARKRRQHYQPPFPDPVTVAGLRRLIRRYRPDIVHSYGWFSYSCAAALLGTDIPLLLTSRDYAYSCATRTLFHNGGHCSGPGLMKCVRCAGAEYGPSKGLVAALGVRLSAPLLRRKLRAIHSISSYVQTIIRRDFLDDRNAETTATGSIVHDVIGSVHEEDVSFESDGSLDRYLVQLPAEPFLLFVGALRRVKGVGQLLEAYQQLQEPPPLVLIGTLERDSPPLPPGVVVLRDLPHPAVLAAWERSLFGVLPSVLPEPFGTVVCEAMSRGKAVIGTQPGGHSDMIVPEETGLLVPPGDVHALTRAIERLIQESRLRDRLGREARVRARRFTPEVAIPRIERIYVELMARNETQ